MLSGSARFLAVTACMAAMAATMVPAAAHAQVEEARLRKIEAEVRAIQRKVFPGGAGRFFEGGTANAAAAAGLPPATSAVTDILARMDALESQLASLTAQVENNTNNIALLTGQMVKSHPEFISSSVAVPAPGQVASASAGIMPVAIPGASTPPAIAGSVSPTSAAAAPVIQPAPAAVVAPPAKPVVAAPSASRLAAVQAIAKPATNDPGDDEYSYGFRLWNAKFYPEAQQQLRLFVDKYPRHERASYGRNLLGRAYLDDGKPDDAAPWFLKNYQADKAGARAGDSLLYLAEAMISSGDMTRACIALAEFGETYPALAAGRLQDQYETNRKKVTCE